METKKMSLANIQGRISRAEMKNIMAGSEGGECVECTSTSGYTSCWYTTGSAYELCTRVYGANFDSHRDVPCNGCTMN